MSVRLFFRFSHLHLAAAFAALLGGMQAARADITDWARSEGGQMRVASLAVDANGVVGGVLQIEPKDGWKPIGANPEKQAYRRRSRLIRPAVRC